MIAVLARSSDQATSSKGMELIDDMHTSTEEEIAAKSKAKQDLLTAYAPL